MSSVRRPLHPTQGGVSTSRVSDKKRIINRRQSLQVLPSTHENAPDLRSANDIRESEQHFRSEYEKCSRRERKMKKQHETALKKISTLEERVKELENQIAVVTEERDAAVEANSRAQLEKNELQTRFDRLRLNPDSLEPVDGPWLELLTNAKAFTEEFSSTLQTTQESVAEALSEATRTLSKAQRLETCGPRVSSPMVTLCLPNTNGADAPFTPSPNRTPLANTSFVVNESPIQTTLTSESPLKLLTQSPTSKAPCQQPPVEADLSEPSSPLLPDSPSATSATPTKILPPSPLLLLTPSIPIKSDGAPTVPNTASALLAIDDLLSASVPAQPSCHAAQLVPVYLQTPLRAKPPSPLPAVLHPGVASTLLDEPVCRFGEEYDSPVLHGTTDPTPRGLGSSPLTASNAMVGGLVSPMRPLCLVEDRGYSSASPSPSVLSYSSPSHAQLTSSRTGQLPPTPQFEDHYAGLGPAIDSPSRVQTTAPAPKSPCLMCEASDDDSAENVPSSVEENLSDNADTDNADTDKCMPSNEIETESMDPSVADVELANSVDKTDLLDETASSTPKAIMREAADDLPVDEAPLEGDCVDCPPQEGAMICVNSVDSVVRDSPGEGVVNDESANTSKDVVDGEIFMTGNDEIRDAENDAKNPQCHSQQTGHSTCVLMSPQPSVAEQSSDGKNEANLPQTIESHEIPPAPISTRHLLTPNRSLLGDSCLSELNSASFLHNDVSFMTVASRIMSPGTPGSGSVWLDEDVFMTPQSVSASLSSLHRATSETDFQADSPV